MKLANQCANCVQRVEKEVCAHIADQDLIAGMRTKWILINASNASQAIMQRRLSSRFVRIAQQDITIHRQEEQFV